MKAFVFVLHGVCMVPDGTVEVEGLANHVRLPGGQIISNHRVIAMASGPDSDGHRDLSHDEAAALELYIEIEECSSDLVSDAE